MSLFKYAVALGLSGGLPLLLAPVLSRALSVESFGELSAAILYVSTLGVLCTLSIHGFVSVRYHKVDVERFTELFSVSQLIFIISWLIFNTLFYCLFCYGVINIPFHLYVFFPPISFFLGLNLIYLAYFQTAEKVNEFSVSKLVTSTLDYAICICIVLAFGHYADFSRLVSWMIGLAVALAVSIYIAKMEFRCHFGKNKVLEILKYCLPLFPHVAVGLLNGLIDKIVVYEKLGPAVMAQYVTAVYLGAALLICIEPFNKAFAPWMFKELQAKNFKKVSQYIKFYYGLLVICTVLFYFAGAFFIKYLMPGEYQNALNYLGIILLGVAFQGFYFVRANILFFYERNSLISYISFSVFVLNVFSSILMVEKFGALGAAIAFLTSNIVAYGLVHAAATNTLHGEEA